MRTNLLAPDFSRDALRADCASCVGLCCVALAFTRSADFGFDKDAAEACVNLEQDFACSIHPHLRERGMRGCTVFDCLGAGQRVTVAARVSGAPDWRSQPDAGAAMFAAFALVRQLHELLWYLVEARDRLAPRRDGESMVLRAECEAALVAIDDLATRTGDEGASSVVAEQRPRVVDLLSRVSSSVRDQPSASLPRRVGAGADLIGARLAGLDLSNANLRGAYLIAADLTGAKLDDTDLIGADLRDTRLHGADLSRALFLTPPQVNAALGDAATRLPDALARPPHWS